MDYTLLYSRYQEAVSTDSEVRTFYSLNPKLDGVYLNWGCGTGNQTISLLRSKGYDVWGFEPSGHASSPFVVSSRDEISARFDGIFSNNVIEHFREPRDQFEEFRRLLKPSALMAHSSPCYEYAYAFTRFHTLFLIGRSADVLAERTGFRVKHREKDGEYINVVFELRDL
jgi:SAM-dependent methyltransferase